MMDLRDEEVPQRPNVGLGLVGCHGMLQTLQGSFSALSKRKFASKYVFEKEKALAEIHTMHLNRIPR